MIEQDLEEITKKIQSLLSDTKDKKLQSHDRQHHERTRHIEEYMKSLMELQ